MDEIETQGFCVIRAALDGAMVKRLQDQCGERLRVADGGRNARSAAGSVYAARNVLDAIPESRTLWRGGDLEDLLRRVLGTKFGLVRGLYFDKPPDRSWALPWHKDTAIAVQDNRLSSRHFSRPTNKAGVPHVIASDEILRRMLTLRIHLDDVTDENGPLRVVPGSHESKASQGQGIDSAVIIYAKAGDVLAMRPLIDHASSSSVEGTDRHRRILHLEFAADPVLPDGYRWFRFIAVGSAETSTVGHGPADDTLRTDVDPRNE